MSDYAAARRVTTLREDAPLRLPELEIQARLFAGEFGTQWTTTTGETIEILSFGQWNREAGPDFKNVRVRAGDGAVLSGDLEVDGEARDWENHGHALDPAYSDVVLQLFVESPGATAFARTLDHREVRQAQLIIEPVPRPVLRAVPGFVGEKEARQMIAEAADFRLRRKRDYFSRSAALHGADGALLQAIAMGLGYKNNAVPFLLTAQRAGGSGTASEVEARLFGIAGFLESPTFDEAPEVTRDYLKPLWEEWWRVRDTFRLLVLPRGFWKFSGIRPANHPHRRMGALAAVLRDFSRLRSQVKTSGAKGFRLFFESLSHPYWERHWNLSARVLDRQIGLVGVDRIADLLVNAYAPSIPLEEARAVWAACQGPTPSGKVLRAIEWLIGRDASLPLRSALDQQGLLQLYADFGTLQPLEAWAAIEQGSGRG